MTSEIIDTPEYTLIKRFHFADNCKNTLNVYSILI